MTFESVYYKTTERLPVKKLWKLRTANLCLVRNRGMTEGERERVEDKRSVKSGE